MKNKKHPPETQGYVFNHTMLRVKDPKASLKFYCDILGMQVLRQADYEQGEFSLYFLGYVPQDQNIPKDRNGSYTFGREAVLELTHNWGTENLDSTPYHNGNSDPRGFGHICISVPDIKAACERFETLGVPFQKKLNEGNMKNIAFIKDPDGYWVEIVQPSLMSF